MANENLSVYDRICRTRKSGRATASDYINATITDFVELHGDRCFADDHAIVGGIGRLNGKPVTVIGKRKRFKRKTFKEFWLRSSRRIQKSIKTYKAG